MQKLLSLFVLLLCLLVLPVSAQEATPAAEVTVETTLEATAEVTAAPAATEAANPASAENPAAELPPAGLSTLLLMGGIFAILVVGGMTMREDRKNRAGKSS